jgi:hypothetical protein
VRREIQTVEIITWSWAEFWQALGNTRGIRCIVIGLVLGLVIFGPSRGPVVGLALGLLSGLLVGLGLWQNNRLIVGLAYKRLDKQNITVPNQGISRSLRYSVVVLVTAWLLSGVILGLLNGPVFGFLNGLLFGLISGLLSGGLAWIQHMILRLLLWKTKYAPLNYQRFLHYAAGCNLIYSVGGGYTFFHPQLQDYFTSRLKEDFPMLNPTPTLDAREKQGQDRLSPDKVTKQAQTTDPASYPASKRQRMRARRKSLPHPKV